MFKKDYNNVALIAQTKAIDKAVKKKGSYSEVARLLGISRQSLYRYTNSVYPMPLRHYLHLIDMAKKKDAGSS